MKKKLMNLLSKVMTLVLALVMTVGSTGVTAVFATDPTTYNANANITISNLESGGSVSLYKIMTLGADSSNNPNNTYYWESFVVNMINASNNATYKSYMDTTNNNAVTDTYRKISDNTSALKTFISDLMNYIKNNSTTATYSGNASGEENAGYRTKIDNVAAGSYIAMATGTAKVYNATIINNLPSKTTNNDQTETWSLNAKTVPVKATEPNITKAVDDQTVYIGQELTYTLTATIPEYPLTSKVMKNALNDNKLITIEDEMGDGLTYSELVSVKQGDTLLTSGKDYVLTTPTNGSNKLSIKLTQSYLSGIDTAAENSSGHIETNGATLTIIYKVKVNTSIEGSADKYALGNTATLYYYADPNAATLEAKKKTASQNVYTYAVNISKVNHNFANLAGAKFKIYKQDTAPTSSSTALKFSEGTATTSMNIYNYDSTNGSAEVSVGDHGMLQLRGLDTGTYYLQETGAPTGGNYNVPSESSYIKFVLEDGGNTGIADGNLDEPKVELNGYELMSRANIYTGTDGKKKILSMTIVNEATDASLSLPRTGGIGTTIFTVGGIALMAGAIAYMIISKKKKNAE